MKSNKAEIDTREFIIGSIDKAYSLFERKLERSTKQYSEPGIHDLRVSIRRMLSLLMLLENFTDVPYLLDLKKSLKKMLKSLNPLRDTQVEVSVLKSLVFKFPVLYTFYIHTLNNEMALAEKAGIKIRNTDKESMDGLAFFLKLFIRQKFSSLGFYKEKILNLKKTAFGELTCLYSAAARDDMESIHKVRLALKRYRYLEEALKPIFSLPKERLKAMKGLQDILGEIQDYTVFLNRLNNFIFSQKVIPAEKFADALKYLGKMRGEPTKILFEKREEFILLFSDDYT